MGETYYAIQRAMRCDTITGGVGLWQASKERLPAGTLREGGKESDLSRRQVISRPQPAGRSGHARVVLNLSR